MSPLDSMRLRMRETGLYELTGNTLADWELDAYSQGLQSLYEKVSALLKNTFPGRSEGEGLAAWEASVGFSGKGLSEEERRRRLLGRLSAPLGTKAGLEQLADSFGVPVSIGERAEEGAFYCMTKGTPEEWDIERFRKMFTRFAPAHLRVFLDMRPLSWLDIEAGGRSWAEMESSSLTWGQIDAYHGPVEELS